ncbi:hypothetical protein JNUCC0626_36320 [Lentzea sp. JNUCC 0626]|uniref:hypothetical protein n=1 Tax=Lentzea sp. JNUCC 0626 TaxID=3367513 RepID=UPI003747CB65
MSAEGSNVETVPTTDSPEVPDVRLRRNILVLRMALVIIAIAGALAWVIMRFVISDGNISDAKTAKTTAEKANEAASRVFVSRGDDLRSARSSLNSATSSVVLLPSTSQVESLKAAVKFAEDEYQSSKVKAEETAQVLKDANARFDAANAYEPRLMTILYVGLGAVFVLCLLYVPSVRYLRLEAERRDEISQAIKSIEDEEIKEPSAEFESLWLSNKQQLRHYHRLVLGYAESTRQLTRFTLVGAALLMLALGVFSMFARDTSSAIASSVLVAASAAVTGYLARAVLRNSEGSSKELGEFFAHPLEVEKALAAERLVLTMPENEQSAAKLIIVKFLASKPVPMLVQPAEAVPGETDLTSP